MNILIALDYTKNREQLLDKGIQFATAMNTSLTLLHVFSPVIENAQSDTQVNDLSSIPTTEISKTDYETWQQAAHKSEKRLQALVDDIRTTGITVQGQHILGQPGPVICARAAQINADVIMIGRRSTQNQKEKALGSVSNFVVHNAPCSVWIIQEDE